MDGKQKSAEGVPHPADLLAIETAAVRDTRPAAGYTSFQRL